MPRQYSKSLFPHTLRLPYTQDENPFKAEQLSSASVLFLARSSSADDLALHVPQGNASRSAVSAPSSPVMARQITQAQQAHLRQV